MTSTLIWGDCLEVMKDISQGSVDMILSDIPYGKTRGKWDTPINLTKLWECFRYVIKSDGAVILTSAEPFTSFLVMSNLDWFRYDLIWNKNKVTGHLNAKIMPLRKHENILVFYNKVPIYNPQKTYGHKPVNKYLKRGNQNNIYGKEDRRHGGGQTDRYPSSILNFKVVNNDDPLRKHPTQKPVEMLRWLIRSYSNEGDTILDCCMGSGSTGVAAVQENRNFIGIELDYQFYQKAKGWMNVYKIN